MNTVTHVIKLNDDLFCVIMDDLTHHVFDCEGNDFLHVSPKNQKIIDDALIKTQQSPLLNFKWIANHIGYDNITDIPKQIWYDIKDNINCEHEVFCYYKRPDDVIFRAPIQRQICTGKKVSNITLSIYATSNLTHGNIRLPSELLEDFTAVMNEVFDYD